MCTCHPAYHDLGVHAPTPELPAEPTDLGKAHGSAGHFLRAISLYVGVPLTCWAFVAALIWLT